MQQRQIGTGLSVSELCLGTMFFGTTVDEATSFAILDRFAEAGGNFVDTANCYSFWTEHGTGDESESLIGRWLRRRGDRDRFVIATKVGARPKLPGAPVPDGAEGLSAQVIRAQANASLRRLGTDHIDLYYAHIDDQNVPQEETLGAFNELVIAGTARVLGCSNYTTDRLVSARRTATANGWLAYDCVQQRHTYLTPAPDADFGGQVIADQALFEYARGETNLTVLAYSPLLSGSYVRADRPVPPEYRHPGTADRLAAVHEVAESLGATPNQVVLAWLLGGDPQVLPVIGVSSVAQLDECLRSVDVGLDEPHRYRLDGGPYARAARPLPADDRRPNPAKGRDGSLRDDGPGAS